VVAGEVDELFRSLDDGAALGRSCNRGATPAPELEQSLVAEDPRTLRNSCLGLTGHLSNRKLMSLIKSLTNCSCAEAGV
jgi:hypothetical protein